MSLLDSIKIALSSILAHKLRSALTMLGIIIGVGSIITVVAIGQGGEAMLKSKFAGSGGNNLMPIQFKPDMNDEFAIGGFEIPKLTEEDIMEVKQVKDVSHVITTNSTTEILDVNDKKVRVCNYHHETVKACVELMSAAGIKHSNDLQRAHIYRRVSANQIQTYAEMYPYLLKGSLLEAPYPKGWELEVMHSTEASFDSMLKPVH